MSEVHRARSAWIGAALLMAVGASQAAFTTYATQAGFLQNVGASGTDSFDDIVAGELPSAVNRAAGSFTYTAAAVAGLFGSGSGMDGWLSSVDRRDAVSFTGFGSDVTSVGGAFFGTGEMGDLLLNQAIVVTVTDVNLNQSSTTLGINSASTFFGVVSTAPLLSLTVSVAESNFLAAWPTVGQLTVAAAVPEPSAYALFGAGLALVGFLARRRRDA